MWDFAAFTRPDHGVPANVAYAHHDNNRNVLDEWVCICQGSEGPKRPLTLLAVK